MHFFEVICLYSPQTDFLLDVGKYMSVSIYNLCKSECPLSVTIYISAET